MKDGHSSHLNVKNPSGFNFESDTPTGRILALKSKSMELDRRTRANREVTPFWIVPGRAGTRLRSQCHLRFGRKAFTIIRTELHCYMAHWCYARKLKGTPSL